MVNTRKTTHFSLPWFRFPVQETENEGDVSVMIRIHPDKSGCCLKMLIPNSRYIKLLLCFPKYFIKYRYHLIKF